MLFRFWVFPDCTFLDISNTHQMLFDDSDVQQVREYVLGGK